MFDMYMTMKRDPFNMHRLQRVRQTERYLHKLEKAREAERREKDKQKPLVLQEKENLNPKLCKIGGKVAKPQNIEGAFAHHKA